jgi:hypothetical protein
MKAYYQIFILALLTLGSCTSRLYTGGEYDDLYYSSSDEPVARSNRAGNDRIAEGTLKSNDYYDNIYAADTLVSDEYNSAVDYNNAYVDNGTYDGQYDYYNDLSYAGRLRRFHGNYFDPYWRDPFYSYGSPSFGFGYGMGGYPYNYYFGDPYYSYGGYYGDMYGGYYGGLYGGYYGGFGSYFSPYYGYPGYYGIVNIYNEGRNHNDYGRKERPSTMSSRWNNNINPLGSSRRDSYYSSGGNSVISRRNVSGVSGISGNQSVTNNSRRVVSNNSVSQQNGNPTGRTLVQDQNRGGINRGTVSPASRRAPDARPEYNSANRSYTPSYSNPRMSTRPSYNNSRVPDGNNSAAGRGYEIGNTRRMENNSGSRSNTDAGSYQRSYNNGRTNSSGGTIQRRSGSPSGYSAPSGFTRSYSPRSSGSYSVPSRSSVESRSSISSGSYNNSSSGGGRSSSSYSGGSSGSGSRGSYSSGSSSGSSSHRR